MANATALELSIDQLRQLANDPTTTLAQLPAVLTSLMGQDEERIQWACEALENCGVPQASQVNELVPMLKHDDALVASWTCKLLARMEQASSPAQPYLVELLKNHSDQLVREEAARALGCASRTLFGCAFCFGASRHGWRSSFEETSYYRLGSLNLRRLWRKGQVGREPELCEQDVRDPSVEKPAPFRELANW